MQMVWMFEVKVGVVLEAPHRQIQQSSESQEKI